MENTVENYRSEAQLQAACAQWFWNTFPQERRMLFHVDNNSWNKIIGAQKKAIGVCAGPSDFVFICGTVIFIEMKLPGERQTNEQIDFMNKVTSRGHQYVVMEYFSDFKNFILRKLTT